MLAAKHGREQLCNKAQERVRAHGKESKILILMVRKEFVVEEIAKIMNNAEHIRNIAIIAHVLHGKTTLTDSLLVKAGIISKECRRRALHELRGDREGQANDNQVCQHITRVQLQRHDYIINLIDTPGHVHSGAT